jgi:phosphoglycerate dehydrogenase-like enzyme
MLAKKQYIYSILSFKLAAFQGAEARVEVGQEKPTIGILGSGDFGRALAGRLAQAGYSVYLGSRDPNRNR